MYRPVKVEDFPAPDDTDNLEGPVADDTDDGSYAHPTGNSELKRILCVLAIVLVLFTFVYCCAKHFEESNRAREIRAKKLREEDEIQLQSREDTD